MRYITTTDTNITFTDVDGKVKIVPKNRVYTHFNVDTVTFLLIERYDNEGICLFSTKASDLEINGETYTYQQLLDGEGISDLFSPTGLSFEVVDELPETGEEGIIYLLPNEDDTYTEYIWVSDIQDFEIIGTTDVDLANYYTKAQVDALIPTNVSDLTNDAGYITQEDVIINESFPSGWHTTGTMADLITDINADSDAVVGKAYMNTVSFSDLPSGISQAELKVDVISELQGEGKVLVFTVTSSDVSPYHWEYTSAYGASGTWRSWANSSDLANYYTKSQSDNTFATQTVVNQEIAARIQGDSDINTALGSKADKSDTYTKTQVDNALALKQDASTAFSGNYNDLSNKPDLSVYAESADLATVATSGSYNDLSNKPDLTVYATKADMDVKEEVISTAINDLEVNKQDTLTAGTNITIQNNVISATGGTQVQSDWNQSDSTAVDYIKNKPTIPDVSDYVEKSVFNNKELAVANALVSLNTNKLDASAAFSGNYNDLTNKPTIPDAVSGTNDGTNWTTITIGSTTKAIPSGGGGGGDYVQYDSQDEYPVTLIKRMNRLDYEALAGNEDPNTLYIVTPIEWKVVDDYDYQFGDGNPTDLFAQTLPAQQIAMNEYPTVTLYEDLDMGSSPIQGSWSYDSSEYIGTLTWTDSDGGSCSMIIEFSVIGGSDIVIDDASKITYTNPNNHCYTVEWN